MLGEWLTHLTTPCPKPYRKMGYLKELIAIKQRYRRCRAGWTSHLELCRNLISEAADNCNKTNRVVILGSGLLLDIPLQRLAGLFDEVVLIDVCHLRMTKSEAGMFPNIKLIDADISGVVLPLQRWLSGNRKGPLPTPEIDKGLVAGADYVISSNLLAQLPLTPLGYLQGKTSACSEAELETFGRSIIDHHLSLLQAQDCPVTVISETLRVLIKQDTVTTKIDPLFGAPLNYEGKEWWWDIAPNPELDAETDVRLRVRGIKNLSGADPTRYCRNTTVDPPSNKQTL